MQQFFWCLMTITLIALGGSSARASEVIRFISGDARLVGTLYSAPGPGLHPAIVLLHGSGEEPRTNPTFNTAAARFTAAGFDVFAYDKRGVGESGGKFSHFASLESLALDGIAAIHAMQAHSGIDARRIGVWGISQGAYVGPVMATLSSDVAFVIGVSGGGIAISRQNIFASGSELLNSGYSPEDVREIEQYRRVLWAYYGTGLGKQAAEGMAIQMSGRPWFSRLHFTRAIPDVDTLDPGLRAAMEAGVYDPISDVGRVKVPVLYIFGYKDSLGPSDESASNLMLAYARAGNRHADFIIFPNAGHGLQPVVESVECHVCMERALKQTGTWITVPGFFERTIEWLKSQEKPGVT
ncbi:MAG: alpha/beta fold hydrolase [Candidatus Eremiobacteraeota bacterium]|nr:alpha/beta fold hydrolase [Candidatus Eremiobacteraeota bacterium]